MAAAEIEIQKAVVDRLRGWAGLASTVGTRVYDQPPANDPLPRIKFGDTDTQRADIQCFRGLDIVFTVHIYSRDAGAPEGRMIADEVAKALHMWPAPLPTYGDTVFRHINTLTIPESEGGLTTHSVARFRALPLAASA